MVVPILENWAVISGQVLEIVESEDYLGFERVEILVEQVESVEDYPNLVAVYLQESAEPRLPVYMPQEVVLRAQITTGVLVECRVRRASLDRIFVHRDFVAVIRPD